LFFGMKRFTNLLALLAPLMFAGCATIGPPQPPSLELPKPPSDLRAVRKGDKVTLTWTIPRVTTDRQTVQTVGSTRICRGVDAELTQCGTPVGSSVALPPSPNSPGKKPASSYSDVLPGEALTDNSTGFASYAIEVLNTGGHGAGLSNQVRVPLARTLAPPQDFNAQVTDRGVILAWTNSTPAVPQPRLRYVYRVYRTLEGSQQKTLAGEVRVGDDRNFTLTDSGFEWEKTYDYFVEAVTVTTRENKADVQIEGEDSAAIKVFAHDVFPPAVPSGLQAVFSGPGQKPFIDLIWAPVADIDLDGYYVYRHEAGSALVKVNAETVKTPAYRDMNVVSGKNYFYSVSAVDARGNESSKSEEASERVP
jgi:hypothetical protein